MDSSGVGNAAASATALLHLENQSIKSPKTQKNAELQKTSHEFEAILIKQMLKAMRSTVGKDTLLDGGFAEELYRDMLDDEYASLMSKTANLGIADLIYSRYEQYADENISLVV